MENKTYLNYCIEKINSRPSTNFILEDIARTKGISKDEVIISYIKVKINPDDKFSETKENLIWELLRTGIHHDFYFPKLNNKELSNFE